MRNAYPKYPEDYRIPPRCTASIQWGLTAYWASSVYIRGMTSEQFAQHIATGTVEFVERWNIPPVLVMVIVLMVVLWVFWDYWMLAGRYVP